jgi:hypothetical protein
MSPTARSLAHLRQLGYVVKVVERWNSWAKRREDVFGADLLALRPGEILAVQCTSGANHAARRVKLETEGHAALWNSSGATIEIWSWTKAGPRGEPKRWRLRRETL